MSDYENPLAVYFIWHPVSAPVVKPLVEYAFRYLHRDNTRPHSRSMNMPVFYRTVKDVTAGVPEEKIKDKNTGHCLLFVFIDENIVTSKKWVDYLKKLDTMCRNTQSCSLIPVAINGVGFNIEGEISERNFIRLFEFKAEHRRTLFFIYALHEIYRYLTVKDPSGQQGNASAVKFFLSHTKADEKGVALARQIKEFIENSPMSKFFDTFDIAPAFRFDKEIEEHLQEATLIAIRSDTYHGRYWCQKEIMCGKEQQRPIIAVDYLAAGEDRAFPYLANIPSVHLSPEKEVSDADIYMIIENALLETVRSNFQLQSLKALVNGGFVSSHDKSGIICLTRPPEAIDIINSHKDKAVLYFYPDPPLYIDEKEALEKAGIISFTPLTIAKTDLRNRKIGISISEPDPDELIRIGLGREHLEVLSGEIARFICGCKAKLVYGGDLRENGFTEFLCQEAGALKMRLMKKNKKSEEKFIYNWLAWPLYLHPDEAKEKAYKQFKARYNAIIEMIEVPPPSDLDINKEEFLPPVLVQSRYIWTRNFTHMREKSIAACDARISAGGKLSGHKSKYPGVFEEVLIAIEQKKPLYLLGGFGGVTRAVTDLLISGNQPEELTRAWQEQHTNGYSDIINKYKTEPGQPGIDYEKALAEIKAFGIAGLVNSNGLSEEENLRLLKTRVVEEAIYLILKGLTEIFKD